MENKLTPILIEKAKKTKSVEELLALAEENKIKLSEEEAKAYFGRWTKTGELSDDELDNVSGGGCRGNEVTNNAAQEQWQPMVVTSDHCCENFVYGSMYSNIKGFDAWTKGTKGDQNCSGCFFLYFEDGVGYCTLRL